MFLVGRLYLAFLPLLSAKVKGHTSNTLNFTAKCVGLCAFKTKCNLKKQFSLVYVHFIDKENGRFTRDLFKKCVSFHSSYLRFAFPLNQHRMEFNASGIVTFVITILITSVMSVFLIGHVATHLDVYIQKAVFFWEYCHGCYHLCLPNLHHSKCSVWFNHHNPSCSHRSCHRHSHDPYCSKTRRHHRRSCCHEHTESVGCKHGRCKTWTFNPFRHFRTTVIQTDTIVKFSLFRLLSIFWQQIRHTPPRHRE